MLYFCFHTVFLSKNEDFFLLHPQASNCVTYDAKEKIAPLPLQGHDLTWDEIKDDALQHSSPRYTVHRRNNFNCL